MSLQITSYYFFQVTFNTSFLKMLGLRKIYTFTFMMGAVASIATAGLPNPDLHWSFDSQCTECALCFDSTEPSVSEGYRMTGECNQTLATDILEEGIIGKALTLREQVLRKSNVSESCITVLDKRRREQCTDFTLSFWIRLNNLASGVTEAFLFSSATFEPSKSFPINTGISIRVDQQKKIKANVYSPGVFYEGILWDTLSKGVWTHIIIVWVQMRNLKVYFNGTSQTFLSVRNLDFPRNPNVEHDLVLGGESVNFTIDELKIWFNPYQLDASEIFRQESIDPADFTTTAQLTTTEETTIKKTTTTTTTTATSATTRITTTLTTTTTTEAPRNTDRTTTEPLYIQAADEPLKKVSNDLRENQVETENNDFPDEKTLDYSSKKTMNITDELVEIIKEENIDFTPDVAISLIEVVSDTTNNIVSEENADSWLKLDDERTDMLNQIIENADSVSKVIVDSIAPPPLDEIQVVWSESVSVVLVPTNSEKPVTISASNNVELGLSSSTVTSLSQNNTIVVATSVRLGAQICYDNIPPDDVDIVDREDNSHSMAEPNPEHQKNMRFQIISEIISVNIKPEPEENEIKLIFRHTYNISENQNYTIYCAYINKTSGRWTNLNCDITETNRTHTSIVSKHLTNFAILMQIVDFEIPEQHLQNLALITYIGCSISIFSLVLSLCVFALVNNIRGHRTERYHLHANLALAMLLGQVTFLAGARHRPQTDSCKATAILLHFFYLSAFSWMLVEGLHLYNLVVKVFKSADSKLAYYYLVGWGAPLLICVISVAAAFQGYGEVSNCWLDLENTRVIWAFVGPVLFIILVNTFILARVAVVIATLAKSKDNCLKCMTDKATVVICAKAIAVLMPILGITWIFGVFAVNEETIVFQYIFAVCNSLQGFFLFMFHCVFNSETRASLIYRTKSMRTDLSSRSATNSRSRRPTKVELVKNAEQADSSSTANMEPAASRQRDRCRVNPSFSEETPMSSREASLASSDGTQSLHNSDRKITTRRIHPNFSRAW